jgi:hypothetical protein
MSGNTNKMMSHIEKQNNERKKAILSSRKVALITKSEAWEFAEMEYKKYAGSIDTIKPDDIADIINAYTKMQKEQQHYNMINGQERISNAGIVQLKPRVWFYMTLAPKYPVQFGGSLFEGNYIPVPVYFVSKVGFVDYPESPTPFQERLWIKGEPVQEPEPGEKKPGKLFNFISKRILRDVESFFNKIKVYQPDYRKRNELQIIDIPLYHQVVTDYKNARILSKVVAAFENLKKQLKKDEVWLLEMAAIAFYYSILTYDEKEFIKNVLDLTEDKKDDKQGKDHKPDDATHDSKRKLVEEIQITVLEYTGIDFNNERDKMNDFYKQMFTHPAKSLFEYE